MTKPEVRAATNRPRRHLTQHRDARVTYTPAVPTVKDPWEFHWRARFPRAIDGDTVEVEVDRGDHDRSTWRLRLNRVDAPELFSGTNREAGAAARDFVTGWLTVAPVEPFVKWPYRMQSFKTDSFGRWVVTFHRRSDEANLGDDLVDAGHAVERTFTVYRD